MPDNGDLGRRGKYNSAELERYRDSFYTGIRREQLDLYQRYLDIAFDASPTLRVEEEAAFFNPWYQQAASEDDMDPLALEMMLLQYAKADPWERERYRGCWAETVVFPPVQPFFPSPWQIIQDLFEDKSMVRSHCAKKPAR